MKRRNVIYPWHYQGKPSPAAKLKAKRSLRRLERRMAKKDIIMDDSDIHFVDFPPELFPVEITWTDIDTGELVRQHHIDGPGVLADGGFGKGRNLRMVVKFGNGDTATYLLARKE